MTTKSRSVYVVNQEHIGILTYPNFQMSEPLHLAKPEEIEVFTSFAKARESILAMNFDNHVVSEDNFPMDYAGAHTFIYWVHDFQGTIYVYNYRITRVELNI